MQTRRRFMRTAAWTASAALLAGMRLSRAATELRPAPSRPRAVSAGRVRVMQGPWTHLPIMASGVYLENLHLLMPDGVRLNAFLYLPDDMSGSRRLPALFNTTPYRYGPRSDSYYARHGYASLFVDVRGTGASEGRPEDEYSAAEHQDSVHIIDWLSKQPWSNGNVGMWGSSYGAFNALWIAAALKPPALKAIFLQCGTDNRYTDDIHYPGGCMLMVDNSWALGMLTSNVMPPGPDLNPRSKAAIERWDTPPWLQGYLRQQLDGPYWRHGSLAPDYGRLEIPTFLTGGYLDVYQNFVPRIMRNAGNALTRGILGPWDHSQDEPGPKLDWDALFVRWFDQWLKGADSGLDREPRLSFYVPEWRRQSFRYTGQVPGEWRFLDEWPSSAFEPPLKLFLRPEPERALDDSLSRDPAPGDGGRLAEMAGVESALRLNYYPGSGGTDQSFGPTSGEGWYGLDRRADDTWGLSFDTPELTEHVEIFGFVNARLFVSATAHVANWIVRLCDVAPDGTSYLITRGYLNGTHRQSHTKPEPLVPGQLYELGIEAFCTAWRFAPGHRIRIVIANADFPVLWPSPYNMTTTLYTGGAHASCVFLPVLSKQLAYRDGQLPSAVDAETLQLRTSKALPGESWYTLGHDVAAGVSYATVNLPYASKIRCSVSDRDPSNAALEITGAASEEHGSRVVEIRTSGSLRSTVDEFITSIDVELLENGRAVRKRSWTDRVKRQLV